MLPLAAFLSLPFQKARFRLWLNLRTFFSRFPSMNIRFHALAAPMCLAQALTVALASRLQGSEDEPRIPTVTGQ